jgi:hypothetical protein
MARKLSKEGADRSGAAREVHRPGREVSVTEASPGEATDGHPPEVA